MNRAEAIKELDKAIISLNSLFNAYDSGDGGESLKKSIQNLLQRIRSSENVIYAIENVSFGHRYDPSFTSFGMQGSSDRGYKQGIQMFIDILSQERERLLHASQKEEQERNFMMQIKSYKMQLWTLIFSAIAAVVAIASLLLGVFR